MREREERGEPRHRCRVSYRPLDGVIEQLGRIDEALTAMGRVLDRRGGRQRALPVGEDRTVLVEGGGPYTTLYVTPEPVAAGSGELRPLIDLSSFWRVWRPPLVLLGPGDRRWLARRGLARDPAPPLPARWDREHGWRDLPADRLPEFATIAERTSQLLRDTPSDRKKGAA